MLVIGVLDHGASKLSLTAKQMTAVLLGSVAIFSLR
jgi:hypothetical protein